MAEAEWYYTRNNQQQGPVTFEALQSMAASGQVAREDLIWQQGMPNWQPAGQVAGIFGGGAPGGPSPVALNPSGFVPPSGYAPPAGGFAPGPGGGPIGFGGYNPAAGPSSAAEAKTAMICSIVGIFCCGIILGPIGLIKGLNAQKAMQASGNFEGKGMATAAVVCGIIAIVLFVVGVVVQFSMRSGSRGF